jgi:hypothetical protein
MINIPILWMSHKIHINFVIDMEYMLYRHGGSNVQIKSMDLIAACISDYFLEDCIQMLNFIPPPNDRKKRKDKDELDAELDQEVRHVLIAR